MVEFIEEESRLTITGLKDWEEVIPSSRIRLLMSRIFFSLIFKASA